MIIRTDLDLYKSFLEGIHKSKTGTIQPSEFNIRINEAVLNIIKGKLPTAEFNQKRIDDLEFLRVVTDGQFGYPPIAPYLTGIFLVPNTYTGIVNGILMSGETYPQYLHGLNVMFYVTSSISGDSANNTWIGAKVLRSDLRVFNEQLTYRRPSPKRIYFEMIAGKIRFIGPSQFTATQMRLEYARYPKQIEYVDGVENILEFNPSLSQEISEFAIRQYLEKTKNPRYTTFRHEEGILSQGKN